MTICGVPSKAPTVEHATFLGVIWGAAGAGKTVLASTAPGLILQYNFDPGGMLSLGDRSDILGVDLSAEKYTILSKMRVESDPGEMVKTFKAMPEIQTVVLDSLTMISELALPLAVSESKNSSLKEPGIHGYSYRNQIVYEIVRNVLKACQQNGKNLIFIAHEQKPEKDEITGRIFQSILVGGELSTLMTNRISEVWYLEDQGKSRKISVRSNPNKRPMKTRLFDTSLNDTFEWKFDARRAVDDQPDHTIRGWLDKWHKGGGKKLQLPA